jgi:hypothetical protein
MTSAENNRPEINHVQEQEGSQRFVLPITEYSSPSSRITGVQELISCSLLTPSPMYVLGHSAFEEYKKSDGFTPELSQQVVEAYQEIRKTNPNRGAYIGRAYYVPGIEAPAGPRTAAIFDEESYLAEAEKFFQFAIENNYDIPEADIAIVFHPFIHVAEPLMIKNPPLEFPGGDVTPLSQEEVLVRTTYGPDEAVQGFPHDEYKIKITPLEIRILKTIGSKTTTLIPREAMEYEEIKLPPEYQDIQALTNLQIFSIAEAYHRIHNVHGPRRLEFIVQPEGIIFRECAPFEFKPEQFSFLGNEDVVEPVVRITSQGDLAKLTPPTAIVYLPPKLFKQRNIDLFALIASFAKEKNINLTILSHGSIATAHLVRIFADLGHSVIFVGDEDFTEEEKVRVFGENGSLKWERITEKGLIIDLKDVTSHPQVEVGGKGANLGKLATSEILIPQGFCLPTELFRQHLISLGLRDKFHTLNTLDGETLKTNTAKHNHSR